MSRRKCCCRSDGGGSPPPPPPPPTDPCREASGFTQTEYSDSFSTPCLNRDLLHGWFGTEICIQDYLDQKGNDLVECYLDFLYSRKRRVTVFGPNQAGKTTDTGFNIYRKFEVPNGTVQNGELNVRASVDLGFERLNRLDYDVQGLWDTSNFPYPAAFFMSVVTTGMVVSIRILSEYQDRGTVYNLGQGNLTLPLDEAYYDAIIQINNLNGIVVDQATFQIPLTSYHNRVSKHSIEIEQKSLVTGRAADFTVTVDLPGQTYEKDLAGYDMAGAFPCNHNHQVRFWANGGRTGVVEGGPAPAFNFNYISIFDGRDAAALFPNWFAAFAMADDFSIEQPNI